MPAGAGKIRLLVPSSPCGNRRAWGPVPKVARPVHPKTPIFNLGQSSFVPTDIPPGWNPMLEEIGRDPRGTVYILGSIDQGKTTLCTVLQELAGDSCSVAVLDCDPGQSSLGPPATVGLSLPGVPGPLLKFVGSTSPSGHFLPLMAGAARLQDIALRRHADLILVDSPGYVQDEAAQEFHIRMIDLLAPRFLVGIERERELDPILAPFSRSGASVHRIRPSPSVAPRSTAWRKKHREELFGDYFRAGCLHRLPLQGLAIHGNVPNSFRREDWTSRLVALCDPGLLVVRLAIVVRLDLEGDVLELFAPPFAPEEVSSVQVGTVRLTLSGEELRKSGIPPAPAPRGSGPGDRSPGSRSQS
jgi:polynucleotide 5'-hydroxyl-kinase GRC3/NOL9